MTAEVAILNKEAVALASDSAVTISQGNGEDDSKQKIFSSANKLFALSKYQPIGIMVYGDAEFMSVPMEVMIKVYREKLGRNKFKTLNEYGTDFIGFLDNGNMMFPDYVQDRFAEETFYAFFSYIKDEIKRRVSSAMTQQGRISRRASISIVKDVIKKQSNIWRTAQNIPSIPARYNHEVLDKYLQVMDRAIQEVFDNTPLSTLDITRLKNCAASLFSKYPEDIQRERNCGVVISGFGTQETFPSLVSFDMEGIVNNRLKYKPYKSTQITFELIGSVIPFAQGEMVNTFMEGIAPDCKEIEISSLNQTFQEYANIITNVLDRYNDREKEPLKDRILSIGNEVLVYLTEKLEEYRKEHHTDPITTVVAMLPKNELAAMAESFVHLTSLKRRYTMEAETVGGAIDVAVISKGDGFIWIKRKHYFQAELNPGFIEKYYERRSNDQ
jgi:hypothetical protein